MLRRKKIFVACGSGVASSETAAYKLRKLLAERKLENMVDIVVVDFKRLKSIAKQADILVHIAPNDPTDYGIPKVNGVPFLTGMGLNQVMDQIEKLIKS